MGGLIGKASNRAQAAPKAPKTSKTPRGPEPAGELAAPAVAAEPDGDGDRTEEPEAGAPAPDGRIRAWFGALLRAALALVITLVVLAVAGGVTDVVLHVTRHTSTNSTSFAGIDGVVVVLDGDVSLHVIGRSRQGMGAMLSAVDTSTPFDDPIRTDDVIGGTLYLTERCPDSRCSADLTLTVDTDDTVNVVAGNGLRLDESVVELEGIVGQASVTADPAKVIVVHTMATGAVFGELECDSVVDCRGIAVPGRR